MEASDELISVVAATTGCTPSEARLALDAAGGSPDLAVEFLLENSGANQNTGVRPMCSIDFSGESEYPVR